MTTNIVTPEILAQYQQEKLATAQTQYDSGQGAIGDVVDATQQGAYEGIAGIADFVGADSLRDWAQEGASDQQWSISQRGREAAQKQFFNEAEGSPVGVDVGEAWTDPRAIAMQIGRVIGMNADIIGGGALVKAGRFAVTNLAKAARSRVLAKGGTEEMANIAAESATTSWMAQQAAKISPELKQLAGSTFDYGSVGHMVSAGSLGIDISNEIESKEWDELATLPEYQNKVMELRQAYPGMEANETLSRARTLLAADAKSALKTNPTLLTANMLVGGLGTAALERILRGAMPAGAGIATEFTVEGAQGALEQVATNQEAQTYVDPNRQLTDGVVAAGLNEAVAGGMVGGVAATAPAAYNKGRDVVRQYQDNQQQSALVSKAQQLTNGPAETEEFKLPPIESAYDVDTAQPELANSQDDAPQAQAEPDISRPVQPTEQDYFDVFKVAQKVYPEFTAQVHKAVNDDPAKVASGYRALANYMESAEYREQADKAIRRRDAWDSLEDDESVVESMAKTYIEDYKAKNGEYPDEYEVSKRFGIGPKDALSMMDAEPVQQPAPSMQQPQQPVQQPAPSMQQPQQPVQQPAPSMQQPQLPVQQPQLPVQQPTPSMQQPQLPVQQPTPSMFNEQELQEQADIEAMLAQRQAQEQNKAQPLAQMGDIRIDAYSPNSIVVRGVTDAHSERLRKVGGKFNDKLAGGAGWIFSKKRQNELEKLIPQWQQKQVELDKNKELSKAPAEQKPQLFTQAKARAAALAERAKATDPEMAAQLTELLPLDQEASFDAGRVKAQLDKFENNLALKEKSKTNAALRAQSPIASVKRTENNPTSEPVSSQQQQPIEVLQGNTNAIQIQPKKVKAKGEDDPKTARIRALVNGAKQGDTIHLSHPVGYAGADEYVVGQVGQQGVRVTDPVSGSGTVLSYSELMNATRKGLKVEVKPQQSTSSTDPIPQTPKAEKSREFPTKQIAESYNHISTTPSRAGQSEQEGFKRTIKSITDEVSPLIKTEAQRAAFESALDQFKGEYINEAVKVADVRKNTVSAHVAGGSNFNSKQAASRGGAYERAQENFTNWVERNTPQIKEAVLQARTPEQRQEESKKTERAASKKAQAEFAKAAGYIADDLRNNRLELAKDTRKVSNAQMSKLLDSMDAGEQILVVEATDKALKELGGLVKVVGERSSLGKRIAKLLPPEHGQSPVEQQSQPAAESDDEQNVIDPRLDKYTEEQLRTINTQMQLVVAGLSGPLANQLKDVMSTVWANHVVSAKGIKRTLRQSFSESAAAVQNLFSQGAELVAEQLQTNADKYLRKAAENPIAHEAYIDLAKEVREGGAGGYVVTPGEALTIARKLSSGRFSPILDRIASHPNFNKLTISFQQTSRTSPEFASGTYSLKKHEITVKSDFSEAATLGGWSFGEVGYDKVSETLTHELIHAVTRSEIEADSAFQNALATIRQQLNKWLASNKDSVERDTLARLKAMQNSNDEVLTYALTEPEIQAVLKQIPSTKNSEKSLFTEFVAAIRKLLGIAEKDTNLLTDIIEVADQFLPAAIKKSEVTIEKYRLLPEEAWPRADWRGDLMKTREYAKNLSKIGALDINEAMKVWKPTTLKELTALVDSAVYEYVEKQDQPRAHPNATAPAKDESQWGHYRVVRDYLKSIVERGNDLDMRGLAYALKTAQKKAKEKKAEQPARFLRIIDQFNFLIGHDESSLEKALGNATDVKKFVDEIEADIGYAQTKSGRIQSLLSWRNGVVDRTKAYRDAKKRILKTQELVQNSAPVPMELTHDFEHLPVLPGNLKLGRYQAMYQRRDWDIASSLKWPHLFPADYKGDMQEQATQQQVVLDKIHALIDAPEKVLNALPKTVVAEALDTVTETHYRNPEFVTDKGATKALMDALALPKEIQSVVAELVLDAKDRGYVVEAASQAEAPANRTSSNTIFTDEGAEKRRALLRSKLGTHYSGLDPEIVEAGIYLAGWHIEKGARSFAAFVKSMLEDMGEPVRPYLKSWYMAAKYDPRTASMDGMSNEAEVSSYNLESNGETTDVSTTRDRVEPNSTQHGDQKRKIEQSDDAGSDRAGRVPSDTESATDDSVRADGGAGLSNNHGAVSGKKRAEQVLHEDGSVRPSAKSRSAGKSGRSNRSNDAGVSPESSGTAATEAVAEQLSTVATTKPQAKRTAVWGDADDILKATPILQPAQAGDIARIEQRFFGTENPGVGYLNTNGTGTGKTFVGLGLIKRFAQSGKTNILIAVPNDGIARQWVKAGKDFFDVDIYMLGQDGQNKTSDAGKGITITSYATFGSNPKLIAERGTYDLIITDESQTLMAGQQAKKTNALKALRAMTNHEEGQHDRALSYYADEQAALDKQKNAYREKLLAKNRMSDFQVNEAVDEMYSEAQGKITKKVNAKHDLFKEQGQYDTKVLFLSATPFAYDRNLEYAEGYLFKYADYGENFTGGYDNAFHGHNAFYIQNFGYKWRYHRLERPGAEVDSGLMERQFHENLKKQGVLGGRTIDVDADYAREFALVDTAAGKKLDDLIELFQEHEIEVAGVKEHPYRELSDVLNTVFDYTHRIKLLEAIKAPDAIKKVQAHLAKGRKVVIFHSYNVGGASNPIAALRAAAPELMEQFEREFPGKANINFGRLSQPLELFRSTFGDRVGFYNGNVSAAERDRVKTEFNRDGSGLDVIVVQQEAGEAGISLHDTTGKHQRVIINIGTPARPTQLIQIEGRIYRVGVVSNAHYTYLTTGTAFERHLFASKIATRASTAENLGMGELARSLKESISEGYLDADYREVGDVLGVGGKERDRPQEISAWDRAKTFYWANLKRNQKTKSAEGEDYFATPEPLGQKMVEWLQPKAGDRLLEPSVGHAAIGRWFGGDTRNKAVEKSYKLASIAKMNFNGEVLNMPFEELPLVNKFDGIAMNPPFGKGGKLAYEHIQKALKHLANGGRVIAIVPDGPAANKRLDALLEDEKNSNIYLAGEVLLPPATFERAGTGVLCKVIILDRFDNNADAPNHQRIDVRNSASIEEFFERIEHLSVKDRKEATPKESDPWQYMDHTIENYGGRVYRLRFHGELPKELLTVMQDDAGNYDGQKTRDTREFTFNSDDGRQDFAKYATQLIDEAKESGIAINFKAPTKRTSAAPVPAPKVAAPEKSTESPSTYFELTRETYMTTKGKPYLISNMLERQDKETYATLQELAKQYGGWTRSQQFLFKTAEDFHQFNNAATQALDSKKTDIKHSKSSAEKRGRGLPVKIVEAEAAQFVKKLNGAAGVTVKVLATQKDAAEHWGRSLRGTTVRGAFVGKDNTVYVIAENIANVDALKTTLTHEIIGHAGLYNVISAADRQAFIDRILQTRSYKAFSDVWAKIDKDYKGHSDAHKAEEVFAYYAQNTPTQSAAKLWWKGLINWIKKTLQAAGLYPKNSVVDDMDDMIAAIQQGFAKQQRGAVEGRNAMAMQSEDNSRVNLHYKAATKRVPELQEAAKQLVAGQLSWEEYDDLVNRFKPVTPYEAVPKAATRQEMERALDANKVNKIGAPYEQLSEGDFVGLRLDIPSYTNHGVWIVSVHEGKKGGKGGAAGKVIGYDSAAIVSNPNLGAAEKPTLQIAAGASKGTIATIGGSWVRKTQDEISAMAQEAIKDNDWIQVGFDPERHSYFFDRDNMEPVTGGDMALQVGGLVLVKNPTYGFKDDFLFSQESNNYREALAKSMKSLRSNQAPIKLGKTPDVMIRFGAPTLDLYIRKETIIKATNGLKEAHDVDMKDIERLPELLSDPIAVLDDSGKDPAQVLIVDAKTQSGRAVAIAIHLAVNEGRLVINRIASAYGKDNFKRMKLLYLNKEKNPELVRLIGPQLPLSGSPVQGSAQNVLTKADLVNENPDIQFSKLTGLSSAASQVADAVSRVNAERLQRWAELFKPSAVWASIKERWPDRMRPTMLQLIPRNYLTDIAGALLPSLRRYNAQVARMEAERNDMLGTIHETADKWRKLVSQDEKTATRMATLMHDATLHGVDPTTETFVPTITRKRYEYLMNKTKAWMQSRSGDAEAVSRGIERRRRIQNAMDRVSDQSEAWLSLSDEFKKLPEAYQQLFKEAAKSYQDMNQARMKAVENRIQDLVLDKRIAAAQIEMMRDEFEVASLSGIYFPLQRFGKYSASAVNSATGELVAYSRFETNAEMQKWIRENQSDTVKVTGGYQMEYSRLMEGVTAGFMKDLLLKLGPIFSRDNKLQDDLYQLFLEHMPQLSMRKHMIHRKGIAGFSQDALRAYASNQFHAAYQVAKIRHTHHMASHMLAMEDEVKLIEDTDDRVKATQVVNEMRQRNEWILNPKGGELANKLTGWGFFWYLGTSPAAALVNVTQTALVALPIVGARYTYKATAVEMGKMSKLFIRTKGDIEKELTVNEKAAHKALIRSGIIDKTMAHDLTGIADGGIGYSPKYHKVMSMAGYMFHKAELFNREVTAMAVYRLAYEKYNKRMPLQDAHREAVREAIELTRLSHFDYANSNRPRFMQSDMARVLLLFRQHAVNMTYRLIRDFQQSFWGKGEDRAIARKQLAGMLGMTFLFAGAAGMPLYSVVAGIANTLLGDDDDPFDFDKAVRDTLADAIGETAASAVMSGIPGTAVGVDLTGRIGLNNLWIKDNNADLDGEAAVQYYAEQALGPMYGILTGWGRGLDLAREGHTGRAWEAAVPKFARDWFKSVRFADEGALSLRGDPIVEDFSWWEIAMQANGFTPLDLSDQYRENSAIKGAERQIFNRRKLLMNRYALGKKTGDSALVTETLADIEAFNQAQPTVKITAADRVKSLKLRKKASERAKNGVIVSDKLANLEQ